MDPVAAGIPIVGMLIPIIIVPTVLAMRQARLVRELEHAERLRALELGRTLTKDESGWSPSRICVGLGVVVPIGVFFCAWMASNSVAAQGALWASAGTVGVAGIVSGAFLAHRHFERTAPARSLEKPHVDADAYDFAGSR